jgi:carboxymethylenebutenolidase
VLLHLAEFDSWDDGADPESFVSRLKEHGTPVVQHVAAGTVHGFANASLRETVDPTAAALAFARSTVFLEEHLN